MTLFLLLFAAAIAHADTNVCPQSPVRAVSAVLSEGEELPFDPADTPLFATAVSSVASQFFGGDNLPVRNKHQESVFEGGMRNSLRASCYLLLHFRNDFNMVPAGSQRAVDRYVYALRKIII